MITDSYMCSIESAGRKVQEEKQCEWQMHRHCCLCHTGQSMQTVQGCWKHACVIICECCLEAAGSKQKQKSV